MLPLAARAPQCSARASAPPQRDKGTKVLRASPSTSRPGVLFCPSCALLLQLQCQLQCSFRLGSTHLQHHLCLMRHVPLSVVFLFLVAIPSAAAAASARCGRGAVEVRAVVQLPRHVREEACGGDAAMAGKRWRSGRAVVRRRARWCLRWAACCPCSGREKQGAKARPHLHCHPPTRERLEQLVAPDHDVVRGRQPGARHGRHAHVQRQRRRPHACAHAMTTPVATGQWRNCSPWPSAASLIISAALHVHVAARAA